MPRPLRVYVDTSVFGGVFDREFEKASTEFFERVRSGEFAVVISAAVSDELFKAPGRVQAFYQEHVADIEIAAIDADAVRLQSAYIAAEAIAPRWQADALHVAVATASGCRAIVSWNFKHIVNFRRISMYNGVNIIQGFAPIAIHTPSEVMTYDDEG